MGCPSAGVARRHGGRVRGGAAHGGGGRLRPEDLDAELDALLTERHEVGGVAAHLKRDGSLEQLREYFVHRSLYQLKEADPQAWMIPRLESQAKASLVAVEYDEFGAGHGERVHVQLFADLMGVAGLDPALAEYLIRAGGSGFGVGRGCSSRRYRVVVARHDGRSCC
jgi:hypothetical protein